MIDVLTVLKVVYFYQQQPSADLTDYERSTQWELVEAPGEFHSIVYSCCLHPYHDITYTIKLKRQALYYAMYLIIPCAMISFLNLLVFLLPPDCNERMTVGKLRVVVLIGFCSVKRIRVFDSPWM